MSMKKLRRGAIDLLLAPFAYPAGLMMRRARRFWRDMPVTRRLLRAAGVLPLRAHYYEPVVHAEDLRRPLEDDRALPGLDLDVDGQLALIASLRYEDELALIPRRPADGRRQEGTFYFENGSFEAGDAEILYGMIRRFRPARIFEIGSGHSTLLARLAIDRNEADDPHYRCRHVCIEPYEQPWLERTGAEIVRSRAELADPALFDALERDDILFVDSSHVIRPQGDVLYEVLEVFGRLAPGVLVHVHDIFTPRDYPAEWVVRDQKLWNEQYLLEAFLAFNSGFTVVAALNHLARHHRPALAAACPVLADDPAAEPRSFWMRRV